ncbi:MAG: glycosyl transferase, partial [Xanthomonas perforans]|nr:glycosyl transferase [Xanthomonas perforans]
RRARAWAQTLLPALPADAPLLLLPGRGTRLKGHSDGLQLLADIRAAGVPAFLWLPGACEPGREAYVRELETEASRLGVAEAIALTEPTARIAEAYAASDLVLQ